MALFSLLKFFSFYAPLGFNPSPATWSRALGDVGAVSPLLIDVYSIAVNFNQRCCFFPSKL